MFYQLIMCLSLSRLMKRIDKELSTMQASKKNHKYSAYLSQCLESLVVHLNNTASLILGTHT